MTYNEILKYINEGYCLYEVIHDTEYCGCNDEYYILSQSGDKCYDYADERSYNHIVDMNIPEYIMNDNFPEYNNADELESELFDLYHEIESNNLLYDIKEISIEDINFYNNEVEDITIL